MVPSQEEQARIVYALNTGDYEYYDRLKNLLIEKGAFIDVTDINKKVNKLIDNVTFLDSEQKDKFGFERDD